MVQTINRNCLQRGLDWCTGCRICAWLWHLALAACFHTIYGLSVWRIWARMLNLRCFFKWIHALFECFRFDVRCFSARSRSLSLSLSGAVPPFVYHVILHMHSKFWIINVLFNYYDDDQILMICRHYTIVLISQPTNQTNNQRYNHTNAK